MEAGPAVHHGLGVLGDLVVEHLGGLVIVGRDGVLVAHGDAAAAAHAAVAVDVRHVNLARLAVGARARADLVEAEGVVRADLGALAAADALLDVDAGFSRGVLLHLARTATAAHAQVLHAATESSLLVTLEVREADHDVGVHEGAADLGVLDVLASHHGHLHLVEALEAVGDDGVAAGLERVEAIGVRAVQVVERVLAAAHVERVAVGDEGFAAQLAHDVDDDAGVVGAQVGQVARLAEVHLDGDELVLHVNLLDARLAHEVVELLGQVGLAVRAHVGEVDLRRRSVRPAL